MLLWDQHTCLALRPDADVDELSRFDRPGGVYASVNVGYSPQSFDDAMAILRAFRTSISTNPRLDLAPTVTDVERITAAGRIAVGFDLEDSGPLAGDLDNVRRFSDLGVRTLLPTYNYQNAAGCGCLDADDAGLSAWGRALVREMNDVGMVVDGSHCSVRTGLDLCEASSKPVVYSHSCLRSIWEHPRNITDDQARACAATGGVIGITGVGIFLGPNTPTLAAMITHLEAAVELVGIEHVGISSDFSFDHADFNQEIANKPRFYDESYTRWGPIEWLPPERLIELDTALSARGWGTDDIEAVLAGNFRRVAKAVWPQRPEDHS